MIPRKRVFLPPMSLGRLSVDGAWVKADNLHLLWRRVLGNELQRQLTGVLRQAVRQVILPDTFKCMDGNRRDMDEVLIFPQ
jgi:hypothetical protein